MPATLRFPLSRRASRFARALPCAMLLAAALATAAPVSAKTTHPAPASTQKRASAKADAAASPSGKQSARTAGKQSGKQAGKQAAKKKEKEDTTPGPLADFGQDKAPDDVVQVANWVSYTRNAKKKAFVLIDKKMARMYVFDPLGRLQEDSPILLGKAIGDGSVPGIGDKPMSEIKDDEKTTPAGRFLARPGENTHREDIIWIDYDAAVSMHRMRKVSEEERRAERMESDDPAEHRISYGCVNVPASFYDKVLRPTVVKYGAYVYVLPETTTPQKVFGAYDVPPRAGQRVALAEAAAGPRPH